MRYFRNHDKSCEVICVKVPIHAVVVALLSAEGIIFDKHRIAIAEEAILFLYGELVHAQECPPCCTAPKSSIKA